MEKVIVWFRQDLRLVDNPAWSKAVASGRAIIPLYIHAPDEAGRWPAGGAACWWLHHALEDLNRHLAELDLHLVIRCGASEDILREVLEETAAGAVFWNRCYEPHRVRLDGKIKSSLRGRNVECWSGNSALLREPWEVATGAGNPYKVYTPYAKACAKLSDPEPVKTEGRPGVPESWPESESLDSLKLLPERDWDSGLKAFWKPVRKEGLARLKAFLSGPVKAYGNDRDYPDVDGTSRLSPYLHWGQIGPREVAAAIRQSSDSKGKATFYRELIWREFAHHVLYHFPDTPEEPLQRKYGRFPWRKDRDQLQAWQRGQTGYPIVDAGMRQLWETGWMHNRVRMIVASFLVKHLLQSWEEGASWFWDTLVDADLASNTLGWQWAGGCGADAAPYFRIFNPMIQSEKFDSKGGYIRRYVPELGKVPDKYIHTPWEMPEDVQKACGCRIGSDYPAPVIEHKAGRERALEALQSIKDNPS